MYIYQLISHTYTNTRYYTHLQIQTIPEATKHTLTVSFETMLAEFIGYVRASDKSLSVYLLKCYRE